MPSPSLTTTSPPTTTSNSGIEPGQQTADFDQTSTADIKTQKVQDNLKPGGKHILAALR